MNTRRPEALRARARRLHAQGQSIAAIARTLDVAYSVAHGWIRSAREPSPALDPVWHLALSGSWRGAV